MHSLSTAIRNVALSGIGPIPVRTLPKELQELSTIYTLKRIVVIKVVFLSIQT